LALTSAMGIRNFLIEGVSGAGKTSVAEELQRRGRNVVHGDRELAYVGDPETGEALGRPPSGEGPDSVRWAHERWIWDVAKVRALVADRSHPQTFFCGGSRNHHRFIDLFDAVFVLDLDADTLARRLAVRPADEFGASPDERALVMRLHATRADLPKSAVILDATAPIQRVVDDLLSHCDPPDGPPARRP